MATNTNRAEIDVRVGNQLKQFRKKFKLTQSQLGEILGVTYQQVQKYESGDNRLDTSAIISLTKQFDIQAAYFFDGEEIKSLPTQIQTDSGLIPEYELLQMMSLFMKIRDSKLRLELLNQARDYSNRNNHSAR